MGKAETQKVHETMLAALSSGDMAAMAGCFAEDAVWHLPGTNPMIAGDHKGRDAVLEFLGTAAEYSQGTFRLEPIAFAYTDDHAFAWQRITAERDGRMLDETEAIVFEVRNGVVTEVWHRPEGDKLDRFFV